MMLGPCVHTYICVYTCHIENKYIHTHSATCDQHSQVSTEQKSCSGHKLLFNFPAEKHRFNQCTILFALTSRLCSSAFSYCIFHRVFKPLCFPALCLKVFPGSSEGSVVHYQVLELIRSYISITQGAPQH